MIKLLYFGLFGERFYLYDQVICRKLQVRSPFFCGQKVQKSIASHRECAHARGNGRRGRGAPEGAHAGGDGGRRRTREATAAGARAGGGKRGNGRRGRGRGALERGGAHAGGDGGRRHTREGRRSSETRAGGGARGRRRRLETRAGGGTRGGDVAANGRKWNGETAAVRARQPMGGAQTARAQAAKVQENGENGQETQQRLR